MIIDDTAILALNGAINITGIAFCTGGAMQTMFCTTIQGGMKGIGAQLAGIGFLIVSAT
ncbi:MAG: hypothetical protein KAJ03_01835 [Gammaproteobacteria bacterium]|nr:hypothetical protein [Gammaproteobacteria bacterium]